MSQLKLKQILEFLSTSPVSGDVLSYNEGTGKYENAALPNTFGVQYEYSSSTSGSVAAGKFRFNSSSNPTAVTISETDLRGVNAAPSLAAMTLSTNNRKSVVVFAATVRF